MHINDINKIHISNIIIQNYGIEEKLKYNIEMMKIDYWILLI